MGALINKINAKNGANKETGAANTREYKISEYWLNPVLVEVNDEGEVINSFSLNLGIPLDSIKMHSISANAPEELAAQLEGRNTFTKEIIDLAHELEPGERKLIRDGDSSIGLELYRRDTSKDSGITPESKEAVKETVKSLLRKLHAD